jgi:hypothetical protein
MPTGPAIRDPGRHLAGAAMARMHADRGVNIVSGVGVSHLVGTERVEG